MAVLVPPRAQPRGRFVTRRPRGFQAGNIRAGRLMMAPALVIPVLLALVFLWGLYVTLRNVRLNRGDRGFIGLDNYARLLGDETFWHSLRVTLQYTAIAIPVQFVLATVIALMLNEPLRGVRIYRALLIIPLMTPPVVGALVWKVLYRSGNGGFFNYVLWELGLPMQGFIGVPEQALPSLIAIDVWLFMPFVATILLAGMQTLPQEPLDAARIDGAGEWQLFWQVKLPMLVPFYVVALFFRVIDSLNVFDTVYGTTSGGPGDSTRVVTINGYETAFPFMSLAYGATIFVALWVVCTGAGSLLYAWVKRTEAA